MKKTNIAVLGATGSIGRSTARVLAAGRERFNVVGLVARSSINELARQAAEFMPRTVITTDENKFDELKKALPAGVNAAAGSDAVIELVTSPEVDTVLVAIVGTGGLEPTVAALRAGKKVALASKEVLVMAGEMIRRELDAGHGSIVPVDSEHSAIYQCLAGRHRDEVAKLWLTASGGAFRDWDRARLETATLADALKHPTWSMGPKVTIDSASLMNKALEMVEARWLFDMPEDKISVLLHPQSLVHSMIELCDGSFIAQMSRPDMRFAIQYALTSPERSADGGLPKLDFSTLTKLEFCRPDTSKYPSLGFARIAMRQGGTLPTVMNAANEVAVEKFRRGELKFTGIWSVIERVMKSHQVMPQSSFEVVREADAWARRTAAAL
ncbi:MAG: 1-deoxy-D-xylulose-5-phosphate reductoisomerase [Victivallaceae bacterium]|nr:1-deoxy-D-xylulose-5-phosphate reductoisomerase [Victivallaceae bacterium]